MSMEEEPVQTTSPAMVMSVSTRSRFLRSIASTDAVTSSGGRVSVRLSSLQNQIMVGISHTETEPFLLCCFAGDWV